MGIPYFRGKIKRMHARERMGCEMNVLYLNTHDIGRYLQTYGYPVHTPNLLQLSREGMAFTQMYCARPNPVLRAGEHY